MEYFHDLMQSNVGNDIRELWLEFEEGETFEAQVAQAIDKLESNLEHNESHLQTWTDKDRERVFQIENYCKIDPFLKAMNDVIIGKAMQKMKGEGL